MCVHINANADLSALNKDKMKGEKSGGPLKYFIASCFSKRACVTEEKLL